LAPDPRMARRSNESPMSATAGTNSSSGSKRERVGPRTPWCPRPSSIGSTDRDIGRRSELPPAAARVPTAIEAGAISFPPPDRFRGIRPQGRQLWGYRNGEPGIGGSSKFCGDYGYDANG